MVACAATITVVSIGIVVIVFCRVQIDDGVGRCDGILQATVALLVSIDVSIADLFVNVRSFVDFVSSLRKGCLIKCSGELHCFVIRENASCPFRHSGWFGWQGSLI